MTTDKLDENIVKEVEANLAIMESNIGRLLNNADSMGFYLCELLEKESISATEAMTSLAVLGDIVSKKVTPFVACKNKCSHCCSQAVAVNTYEANIISEYTGISISDTIKYKTRAVIDIDGTRSKYMGVICPFLDEQGACSIYDVRPEACKTYFNVSNSPDLCMIDKGAFSVPSLNLHGLVAAYAYATYRADWHLDDIRVFFPSVKYGKQV